MSEQYSGTLWVLGGMIALVFTGVGLSLVADRQFGARKTESALSTEIAQQSEWLKTTRISTSHAREVYEQKSRPLFAQMQEIPALEKQIASQQAQIAILRPQVAALDEAMISIEEEFKSYRAAYRYQAWSEAVGEKLPFVELLSGKKYKDVQIQRVTVAGLEITHSDGRARLNPSDLDASWNDRFQWNEKERLALLKTERYSVGAASPRPNPMPPVAPSPVTSVAAGTNDPLDLKKLQIDLTAWNQKVSQLASSYRDAMNNARSGASVPGSLETWESIAYRLRGELDQAKVQRARARAAFIAAGGREESFGNRGR